MSKQVGGMRLEFSGAPEIAAPAEQVSQRLKLAARGKAPGSAVDVSTDLEIEPVAPNRCRLRWSATSEVRGTVASVGARLLTGTAKKLTETFWQQFADRVAQRSHQHPR